MLTCIPCPKLNTTVSLRDAAEDGESNAAATPSPKQAIKALTSQIKGIAVKASGACKTCKSCSCSSRQDRGSDYADSDAEAASERFYGVYRRPESSKCTPRPRGKDLEAKLKAFSSGSATPASVSGRTESALFLEEDKPKEWVAQVEPGVLITFVSLPEGGNDLRRIRFSREIFNKWQAQRWWSENHDRVMELYNVQRSHHPAMPLPTPSKSEDENSKLESAEEDSPVTATPPPEKERPTTHTHSSTGIGHSSSDSVVHHPIPQRTSHGTKFPPKSPNTNATTITETSSVDASARSSSSREMDRYSGDLSVSDLESEWVEQDEPGVYITVRSLPNGARELRRVRFSRERFGETQARLWWEANKTRIQQQYL